MDAGLLYNEYPLMGSGLIPIEYGEQGLFDPFENPASAQFHHRWIAVLAVLAVLAWRSMQKRPTLATDRPILRWWQLQCSSCWESPLCSTVCLWLLVACIRLVP
jgi:heme A synthase